MSQPLGPPQKDGSGLTGQIPGGVEGGSGRGMGRKGSVSFVASLELDKSMNPLEANRSES